MEKKYNHQAWEESLQVQWAKEKVYDLDPKKGPLYSIDTPPPTVSGSLHIGHIFSYTQTDIIARYKRMSGHNVFYPMGFDDNGLPTERFVEKKTKKRPQDVGRSEFIKLCLEQTQKTEKDFEQLWRHIGLSVDWNNVYSTISDETRKISQASFIDLYNKGYIYRKQEPAPFCTQFQTTVAQAELEDKEFDSLFNDIVFKTIDDQGSEKDLIIGTTRPELLSSCVAVFYHPDDERYQHLAGKTARVPLFENEVPIIADDAVVIDKGTGLVMCCTFGDKMDIEWFKKHNLPHKESIGRNGKWVARTGFLAGLKAKDARKAVLAKLDEAGLLVRQKPIKHSVSVFERSGKEIEYIMLNQWFLKILPYKEKLLELADNINWHPTFMKSRFVNWVENLQWDWCLSRQRYYGIAFPVWYCKNPHTQEEEILLPPTDKLPVDPQEQAFPGTLPNDLEGCKDGIYPDTDIMDTWNTSSLTPYICSALYTGTSDNLFDGSSKTILPMSMRPQAHDIIRTWAFYTIVKAWMHDNELPWKDIVISGHVLAAKKEKISKSKGNMPLEPEKLLQQYPADAIRYWTASASLGHDVAFSDTQLKLGKRLVTKLWNACRFAQPHLEGFDPKSFTGTVTNPINLWILSRVYQTYTQYQNGFDKYEYAHALNSVETLFWHDICDNYLELVKDQLFNPEKYDAQTVSETKYTLYTALFNVIQLYAPYVPYITDALYQELFKQYTNASSIHMTVFDKHLASYALEGVSKRIANIILDVVSQVRKLKTEEQLSLKTPLQYLMVVAPKDLHQELQKYTQLMCGVTQAQDVQLLGESAGISYIEQINDQWNATIVSVPDMSGENSKPETEAPTRGQ